MNSRTCGRISTRSVDSSNTERTLNKSFRCWSVSRVHESTSSRNSFRTGLTSVGALISSQVGATVVATLLHTNSMKLSSGVDFCCIHKDPSLSKTGITEDPRFVVLDANAISHADDSVWLIEDSCSLMDSRSSDDSSRKNFSRMFRVLVQIRSRIFDGIRCVNDVIASVMSSTCSGNNSRRQARMASRFDGCR